MISMHKVLGDPCCSWCSGVDILNGVLKTENEFTKKAMVHRAFQAKRKKPEQKHKDREDSVCMVNKEQPTVVHVQGSW